MEFLRPPRASLSRGGCATFGGAFVEKPGRYVSYIHVTAAASDLCGGAMRSPTVKESWAMNSRAVSLIDESL